MTGSKTEIICDKYFDYYQKLKELDQLHTELNFGSNPVKSSKMLTKHST